jgi:hypothetical protein
MISGYLCEPCDFLLRGNLAGCFGTLGAGDGGTLGVPSLLD